MDEKAEITQRVIQDRINSLSESLKRSRLIRDKILSILERVGDVNLKDKDDANKTVESTTHLAKLASLSYMIDEVNDETIDFINQLDNYI